jgi:hypothetical protein
MVSPVGFGTSITPVVSTPPLFGSLKRLVRAKPHLQREEVTNNESLGSRFCRFVGRSPYLYQATWNVSPIKLSATSPRGTQFCFRVSPYLYDRFAHFYVIQSADRTVPGGFSLVVSFLS